MIQDLTPFGFKSFAEVVAAIGKLTKLETSISAAIDKSKVPANETRKLLKSGKIMFILIIKV